MSLNVRMNNKSLANISNVLFLSSINIVIKKTAFNFLQQGDIEIDYNELKVFRSLKRKVELHNVTSQKQSRIDSFFSN